MKRGGVTKEVNTGLEDKKERLPLELEVEETRRYHLIFMTRREGSYSLLKESLSLPGLTEKVRKRAKSKAKRAKMQIEELEVEKEEVTIKDEDEVENKEEGTKKAKMIEGVIVKGIDEEEDKITRVKLTARAVVLLNQQDEKGRTPLKAGVEEGAIEITRACIRDK